MIPPATSAPPPMANPPPPPPPADRIADDFFEQIFSMPSAYAASPDAAGMALQLGPGDPSPSVFPLVPSLDQATASSGNRHLADAEGSSRAQQERDPIQLTTLLPAFGHVQQHQLRPNPPPPVFHGQATHGGMGAGLQYPAPRPRVRARRGQATDPHSIAERLRRERIAERLRALQELVPNTNKTDRAAMLDEVLDYVKFLRLQVKVLSMSRLGGTGAVAQLVADIPLSPLEGDALEGGSKQQVWEKWSTDGTERQVAKLMEEDVGAAMQFLQSKALCMMPISLATAIYHTQQQPDSPCVKPEPNTPS